MLLSDAPDRALEPPLDALLRYARQVALAPQTCSRGDVDALRDAGASDEQIHATVQVAAYFSYINRVADGLGVDLDPGMDPRAEPTGPA